VAPVTVPPVNVLLVEVLPVLNPLNVPPVLLVRAVPFVYVPPVTLISVGKLK
jgi:hypothetical protein